MKACLFGLMLAVVAWPSLVGGQDLASGPDRGQAVPALRVFDATGPHQGEEVDYAADRKDRPTVYVFVAADRWDRPMARFLRNLDEAAQKVDDALVVAVWLTDDPGKTKEYLPRAQQSLQFRATVLTCFPGDKAGPKGWNVNGDGHLTAVVASRRKVATVFGYRSLNETDVPPVAEALKKAAAAR